ncbi:hypothetical protein, partial [Escherichia coli]|uniref:hypothetical protein n=3 Tax=Escherichia coli TaxID=562 RepID=UPI001BC8565F
STPVSSPITYPVATVSCRFPLLSAQLYNGKIRAGYVKWAHFTYPARILPLYSCADKSGKRQETVATGYVIGEETGVPSDTSPVQHYRHYASSVIRSLRSVMTLRRALLVLAQAEGHGGE